MYKFYLEYELKNDRLKTEIIEPIGWDGLELTLKRNEKSHGIDVEYSDLTLKFYGDEAIPILENAYQTDIDSVVIFICENDGQEEYRGIVDFESYNKVFEDGYCYIEVKVADEDIQVLFNNRIDQKVDIDSVEAFDGAALPNYPMLKREIDLPSKEIILQSTINTEEYTQTLGYAWAVHDGTPELDICFLPDIEYIRINDFGAIYNLVHTIGFNRHMNKSGYLGTLSEKTIFFKYFEDTNVRISTVNLRISMDFTMQLIHYAEYSQMFDNSFNDIKFILNKNNVNIYEETIYSSISPLFSYHVKYDKTIPLNDLKNNDTLFFYFSYTRYTSDSNFFLLLNINKAEISVLALSSVNGSKAKLSFLHETLSRITESITDNQLNVKSDYYGRIDSNINPSKKNGIGSFRALATGLRVRNIQIKDEYGNNKDTQFSLSFSDAIKSLTAIDNIGFGFVEEYGKKYLRIENWSWFYKNDIVFNIHNPNQIERGINSKQIFSIFKCGYKKYETENFNGLDAFHTEREYRTRLKLMNNELEQKSDFIADGYAIEYTRRESLNQTSDWRYDNNVFIFCLAKRSKDLPDYYTIDLGADNTGNTIISSDTLYNMRISPARIANRWLNRLLSLGFGKKEDLIFTSGTGNLQAKGSILPDDFTSPGSSTGDDNGIYIENQDFKNNSLILLPELIKISEYQVTSSEYAEIKRNPYGIIMVDDTPCYISEIKYKKQQSTASFVLIPKNV
jgi:hypothetical protein